MSKDLLASQNIKNEILIYFYSINMSEQTLKFGDIVGNKRFLVTVIVNLRNLVT